MAAGIAQIVLVGARGSGKWALQSALVASNQPSFSSQQGGTAVREAVSWPIDNKYYSVETRMRVVQAEVEVAASGQVPDAVLLVINATQPETFAAVQAWNAANDSEEAGVRLVVATHADCLVQHAGADQVDLEPARPPWLEQAMEWSAEQQFEYVECCCTDAKVDARLRLFGDVQGMQRITAALHAHMWPGLIRKPPSSAAPSATESTITASALPPAQPKDSHGGPEELATQPLLPGTQEPNEHIVAAPANGRKHHDPEEAQVEAYEKLMEEMAGAKRSLSMCDDATRRQRAADLALRFAALLGDDSSDVPTDASDAEEE